MTPTPFMSAHSVGSVCVRTALLSGLGARHFFTRCHQVWCAWHEVLCLLPVKWLRAGRCATLGAAGQRVFFILLRGAHAPTLARLQAQRIPHLQGARLFSCEVLPT